VRVLIVEDKKNMAQMLKKAKYMMRRAGHMLGRDAMIEAVWGKGADIEMNTLEAFIKHLRAKIDDGRETKLIQTVRGVGYRIQGGTES